MCNMSKVQPQSICDLGGLLQPQSIWEDIAMDYVEGLPSSKGNNTMLVIYPLID